MHMVAARLGCQSVMLGTGQALAAWTGLLSPCRGFILAGKTAWALGGCITTESADYCVLINEWALSRLRVCFLRLEVDFGSVWESELGEKWR